MATFKLVCAAGANPAEVLPATLIATSVNQARPSPVVEITYKEGPKLSAGDVIEFTGQSGKTASGLDAVIKELRATFPFLKSKNEAQVCFSLSAFFLLPCIGILEEIGSNVFIGRRMAVPSTRIYPPRL